MFHTTHSNETHQHDGNPQQAHSYPIAIDGVIVTCGLRNPFKEIRRTSDHTQIGQSLLRVFMIGAACVILGVRPLDQNLRALFFFAPDLDLRDFNFRRSCIVCWYESSVAAAIDNVLLAEVVLVEESAAEARNADKKSSWMAFLSLARLKC